MIVKIFPIINGAQKGIYHAYAFIDSISLFNSVLFSMMIPCIEVLALECMT